MTDTPDPDRLDFHETLRSGGWIGLGNDTLVVVRNRKKTVRIDLDNVAEVTAQDIDWFLAVLSVALVGVGLGATTRHALGGLAFAGIGVGSLYLTYRKRDRITVTVAGRSKPFRFYPVDAETTYAEMDNALHDRSE